VAIAISILIVLRDGLAPVSTAVEVNMLGVGTGVDDVGINTLSAILSIQILVEGSEGKTVPVRDPSQTPGGILL
jgi:hypothetical protein